MEFIVIGLDDNKEPDFNKHIRSLISSHSVFSGGKRHHELVKKLLPPDYTWIDITVPLDNVFRQYALWGEIVVFASGDPLFFRVCNYDPETIASGKDHTIPLFQFVTNPVTPPASALPRHAYGLSYRAPMA